MLYRRVRSFAVTAAILLLAAGLPSPLRKVAHRGRKYKHRRRPRGLKSPSSAAIDGKPIENASVIFKLKGDKATWS